MSFYAAALPSCAFITFEKIESADQAVAEVCTSSQKSGYLGVTLKSGS